MAVGQAVCFTAPWKPKASTSVRDRELDKSTQLSHAARISAVKKRKKGASDEKPNSKDAIIGVHLDSTATSPTITRRNSRTTASVSPITPPSSDNPFILYHGNSDPFNAFALKITPVINRIITFARDIYFPSVSAPKYLRNVYSPSRRKVEDTQAFRFGLSSSDTAIAHLGTYAAALTRILPLSARRDIQAACLSVRSQALKRTRAFIASHCRKSAQKSSKVSDPPSTDSNSAKPPIELVQQVTYLFQAAGESRDWTSAIVHAKVLSLLLPTLTYEPTSIFLYVNAMHSMLELSAFTQTPAVVKVTDWCPEQWAGLWGYVETALLPLPGQSQKLPGVVAGTELLSTCFLHLKKWFSMADLLRREGQPVEKAKSDVLNLWGHTRLVQDCMELIEYLSKASSARDDTCESRTPTSDQCRYVLDTATAIALLLMIRRHVHYAPLGDEEIDLRDASEVWVPELKKTLSSIECVPTAETIVDKQDDSESTESEDENDRELLLWLYFAGAVFEQTQCLYRDRVQPRDEQEKFWFSHRLKQQTEALKVGDWDTAKPVLEKFAFSDILDPHPSTWWNEVMGRGDG